MAEWYYVQDGQQMGPVSGSQLKSLAAAGGIAREDLVWNQSLPQWTPAGRIRGLSFGGGVAVEGAPAPMPLPTFEPEALPEEAPAEDAPPQAATEATAPLGYQTPGGDAVPTTPRTVEFLRQTKPWVRFVSIMFFIASGLFVLAGVAMLFLGAGGMMGARGRGGKAFGIFGVIMMLVYLGLACLYIFPGLFLGRYASRIGDLTRSGRSHDLEAALEAQRSFWRFMGILIIVGIGVYLLVIVTAISGALR